MEDRWRGDMQAGSRQTGWISEIGLVNQANMIEQLAIAGMAVDHEVQRRLLAEIETIYDTTQEALFMVRVDGNSFRYVKHNAAHSRFTGLASIEGLTPAELVGEETGRVISGNYNRCIAHGGTISYEEELMLPAGTRTWHTTLTPVFETGKPAYIVGSSRDITEECRNAEEMRQLLRRNECLVKVLQHEAQSIPEYLGFVLRQALELTGSICGHIHVRDEASCMFRSSAYISDFADHVCGSACSIDHAVWHESLRKGLPLRLNRPAAHEVPPGCCSRPIARYLSVPVMEGGSLTAVIGVANKPTDYNETDILHLTALMNSVWQSVTRKRAEKSLRESKASQHQLAEELKQFFSINLDLLCINDLDGRFVKVNRSWEQLLGYPAEQLQGRSLLDFVHPDDIAQTISVMNDLACQESVFNFVNRYRCHDGSYKYIEWRSRPLGNQIYAAARDITEHVALQKQLKDQKMQFELAIRGSNDGIWDWDIRNNHLYLSSKGKEQLGYAEHELPNRITALARMIHPDDRRQFIAHMKRYLNGKQSVFSLECRMRHRDGQHRWIWVRGEALRDAKGLATRMAGSQTDITELRLAEQALAHSHDLMRYVIEHNNCAVAIFDSRMDYMYVSQRYLETYRLCSRSIIGLNHYDVFPELPQQWRDVHRRCLKGEILRSNGDERFDRSDGSVDWVTWECRPWHEADGSIGGIILYNEVINERKQLELAIRSEREQFRTTLLSVGDGIISTGIDGRVTVMNPVAEGLTGWSQTEAIGQPVEDVFHIVSELTRKTAASPVRTVLATENIVGLANHTLLVSRDGRETPIENSAAPIRDETGGISGVVIVFRDCSEKKEKQEEIERLSFNDHLTGLYNRRFMENALKRFDCEPNLPLTILVLDVNGLKLTNDAFGHEMGDRLLREVSDVLRRSCRADDILCRTGGDEFAILLPKTSAGQAEIIRRRIIETAGFVRLDSVIVSLAIGYAVKEDPSQPIMDTLREADNRMYRNKVKYGRTMRSQTIETVLRNINNKYDQEQIHTERVSQYCEGIARALGLSAREIEDAKIAGVLHDIGKTMVPPELLNKPGPLTPAELAVVRRHPEIGYQILKSVDEYAAMAEAVLHHHEHWNGGGYPAGLAGVEIPLQARIIGVADAYEAMTARRAYQKSRTRQEAAAELLRCAGNQFDPDIVRIFIERVL